MKCGGDVPQVSKKPVDLGPVDVISGPRVNTPAEKKCLAKYNGYVRTVGPELRSKSLICRGAALSYMWRTGDVKNLAASLKSDIPDVSDTAFRHLKDIMANKPSKKRVRTLLKAFSQNKHNNLIRARIIAALSMNSRIRNNGRLRKRLTMTPRNILNPNSKELHESKMLAVESLGRLRAKKALPELLKIVKEDGNHQLRMAALKACIQIRPRDSKEVIKALVAAGNSLGNRIDQKAMDTAAIIAQKTRDSILKEMMSTFELPDTSNVISYAINMAGIKLKDNPDVLLLASIIEALGHFGASSENAMDLIKFGINSPIWSLRKSAASALTRVDRTDALQLLGQAIQAEKGKDRAWTGYEKLRFLNKAYKETAALADKIDKRNVALYARNFKNKKASAADRLTWIANLKELGTKRALMLLVKVQRNEKEFADVRKAAKEILDEKMPQHVFLPQNPEVEKREAFSGPPSDRSSVPPNLG